MTRTPRCWLAGPGAALALACAAPPPPAPPARLEVELLRGAASLPEYPEIRSERAILLVDLTPSMQQSAPAGTSAAALARAAAEQVLQTLPQSVEASAWVLGGASQPPCGAPFRLHPDPGSDPRRSLGRKLAAARSRSEVSLADTLDALRKELASRDGPPERVHVVVLSDLGEECGGSLCAAAAALVAGGAELHVVSLGGVAAPACLEGIMPSPRDPLTSVVPAPAEGVRFQVFAEGPERRLVAEGLSGTGPISLPAQPVSLVLELESSPELAPIELQPGALTRVRVLDFPAADPPVWRWTAETGLLSPPPGGGS